MFVYHQASGILEQDGRIIGVGYSGHGAGKNNPAMQDQHNVGPIPQGLYRFGPVFDSAELGPCVMRLMPDAANEMFGRSGFLIHGDSITDPGNGSEGCIAIPHQVRELISNANEIELMVEV